MTGRYQMTGEGLSNGAGADSSKVHELFDLPRVLMTFNIVL
jgi:hypothetical protein